jgi:hypothetical protein
VKQPFPQYAVSWRLGVFLTLLCLGQGGGRLALGPAPDTTLFEGELRARLHCRFVLLLIHFIP